MGNGVEIVGDRVIVSTGWICQHMEVSRVALGKWVEKGCPQVTRGRFDLIDVLNWRGVLSSKDASEIADEWDEDDEEGTSLRRQKLAAEVRYKRAQAELSEMRNAINSGKYVERDKLESELSTLFVGLRRAALAIPRRVASLLVGHVGRLEAADIEAQCDTLIRGALARLSVGNLSPIRAARSRSKAEPVEEQSARGDAQPETAKDNDSGEGA